MSDDIQLLRWGVLWRVPLQAWRFNLGQVGRLSVVAKSCVQSSKGKHSPASIWSYLSSPCPVFWQTANTWLGERQV